MILNASLEKSQSGETLKAINMVETANIVLAIDPEIITLTGAMTFPPKNLPIVSQTLNSSVIIIKYHDVFLS